MARVSKSTKGKGKVRVERPPAVVAPGAEPDEVEQSRLVDRAVLDEIVGLQLLIAWAGEGMTDPPRLGWWRTSLVDELGGEDLFKRLTPRTWRWAVLEAARVAARSADAEMRSHASDGDQLRSLFHFGFVIDEQLEDRLAELKRASSDPAEVLPSLATMAQPWSAEAFRTQLRALAEISTTSSSVGIRLKGEMPAAPERAARTLAAAMAPASERYPAPHWKVDA